MYVSPIRLGLTAEDELCEDTDVRCVRVLVGAGGSIPAYEAAKYGLIDAGPAAVLAAASTAIAEADAEQGSADAPAEAEQTETAGDAPADADTDEEPAAEEAAEETKPKRRR